MDKLTNFFKESYEELSQKMTWLSWTQLQQYTVVIITFMVLFAFLVWGMDFVSSNGMRMVYSLFQ